MISYLLPHKVVSIFFAMLFSITMFADYSSTTVPGHGYDSKDFNTVPDSIEADTAISSVLDGFEVQLLYEVPRESEGSWVSLGTDADGNLVASDQGNGGTYRITIGGDEDNPDVTVEKLVMPVSGAQGLLWAFDHLYANVNGTGLFRLRDEKGDGELNLMEFLGGPVYRGEHGNHTVIKTEDGEGLYYVAGNHTPPPADFASSRISGWEEDLLLPRDWDARGHARGILAPGGFIARINPEATEWEMISIGYRNQYDAAINEHGDLFAYDSDMEWDLGMPWYRPTRIVHAVSGSDYGWRSGSGKWPEYYEDSLPPMLNIGPGSPTALEFGYGAAFPAKYQRALYAFDWTFGTIYAIHLTPDGPTYQAEAEEFVSGSPLPVTGGVVGSDGALYFTTGGRNQDSKLYRVIYRGEESTEPAEPVDNTEAREARELRRHLESFHGREHPDAVEEAWTYMDSEDRILRHAARVAVEAQPVDSWAEMALNEENVQARITGLVALARTGPQNLKSDAIQSLLELDAAELTSGQKLGMLRAMALVFMRLGDPDDTERIRVIDTLGEQLPDEDDRVNTELIRLLVYLGDERVIPKALALIRDEQPGQTPDWSESLLERNEDYGGVIQEMIDTPPPTRELRFAYMLRTLREGWTIEQRREYFTFINSAAGRFGGASFEGFLEDMRSEALRNSTEEEREAVADITGIDLAQEPDFDIIPPVGPGREWTIEGAMEELSGHLNDGSDRDFEKGRGLFFAVSCATCHRFDRYGGDIGPDLSNVSRRFRPQGIIEKIIDPNVLISDQYSSSRITLENGTVITGLAIERGENMEIYTRNPDEPPTVVSRDDVVSVEHADVSQMPPGLINSLNADELRDLMAYIMSGGDAEDDIFKSESELEEEEDEEENNENE